jgi:hypothetical protein
MALFRKKDVSTFSRLRAGWPKDSSICISGVQRNRVQNGERGTLQTSVLQLTQFVEGPKERPFQASLVTGELGEGVPLFGVGVDRASEQYLVSVSLVFGLLKLRRQLRSGLIPAGAVAAPQPVHEYVIVYGRVFAKAVRLEGMHPRVEQCGLCPWQALQPPHCVNHAIHNKFLDRSDRREGRSDLVAKILESVRVFVWEDDVTRKKAVAKRVESDHSFPV